MERWSLLCLKRSFSVCFAVISFLIALVSSSSVRSNSLPLGIHPLDAKYFSAEIIKCKDGSKSFTRDRLNDDFCDCLDGSDEPGTSACPAGKFYCRNVGSIPKFIFSSRVNDRFCDCCDGSDEHDGSFICPNTCIMGGIVTKNYISTTTDLHSTEVKEMKIGISLEDLIQTLAGLKMITVAEVALGFFLVAKWISYKRVKSRRRHHR